MKLLLRFFGFLFAAGTILFVVGVAAAAGLLWHFSKDLPDYSQLQDYEPPVMTRVHAADGSLVGEYARERRLYIPIQAVPKLVINAFLAAEDKNFYEHGGLDFAGIARAGVDLCPELRLQPPAAGRLDHHAAGRQELPADQRGFVRRARSRKRCWRSRSSAPIRKDKILELYLNEIYLGLGAYGIAAASLLYFDKSVNELTLAEVAYLAALPKAPNNYHPFRQRERAHRAAQLGDRPHGGSGFIKAADAEKAKSTPLGVTHQPTGAHIFAAEYFAEEVRRELFERYGEKKLYEGGLSVRTTLDPKLQVMARKALTDGLVQFDEAQGYRGPVAKIDVAGDWGVKLAEVKALADVAPWRLAVVLEVERPVGPHRLAAGPRAGRRCQQGARDRHPAARRREVGEERPARPSTKVGQVLKPGDVVYVEPAKNDGQFRLRQVPEVSGAMVVDGSADRPRARHGRRLLLRPEPVQPRHPGAAPARLVVQAVRLRRRARQRLHAVHRGARRADRDRSGPGPRRVEAGKLRRQVLRALDAALRHRAFAQRDDGAARAGRRHAADRRIRQALRRLRRSAALSVRSRSAPARPRCCAWSPPMRCSTMAAGASSRR